MSDWIITLPKHIEWSDYEKELAAVANGQAVMNFKISFAAKAEPGDRCFLCWRGKVRGWMRICGVMHWQGGFRCSTTGAFWSPGFYLQRSGPFHPVDGPAMRGFQGIRRFNWEGS